MNGNDNKILCLAIKKDGEIDTEGTATYEIEIPTKEKFILNKCSPFYKSSLNDAKITPKLKLKFDEEIQISLKNSAFVYNLKEL